MSDENRNREAYREMPPFAEAQDGKDAFFHEEMMRLTEYHRGSCLAYDDICNGLKGFAGTGEEGPYLPVSLFKDLELRSVPAEDVVRQVTSSGTTGQQVSRIYLDADTAELQRWALCTITGDFIGTRRMPMLIIDSPDVLRDRSKFTARGAGILGFSMMSSKRFYALDANMDPDWESIEAFKEAAKDGPSFAFGFTFMIWAYFYQAMKKAGRTLDLGNCYLIHGGGWKKLQDQKVSDEEFRRALKETCGIQHVSDYYGMAEQTGSIFMQCPEGHLHASIYSDIDILDPTDFSPCETGEWGLIALRSWIPGSYPGHRLLTEDRGRILGVDDCPCGRKGKYFEISGRIKKAEIRGCSDTFAANISQDSDLQILAGTWPPEAETRHAFDPLVMDYLEDLSKLFMKDPAYRQFPDIYALGFWLRGAHMSQIQRRQEEAANQDGQTIAGQDGQTVVGQETVGQEAAGAGRSGLGTVLHIAPSNMPTMFAYSWITALLAGNSNVVRISGRENPISDTILQGIRQLLDQPAYEPLRRSNVFVRFPRGHKALEEVSKTAAARMIWGGDQTVHSISQVLAAEGCVDIGFPDKYSIAIIDGEAIKAFTDDELRMQAHLFCRDTYGADQNACSSPRSIFWLAGDDSARQRWWDEVEKEAERYELPPWMATEKYRRLCANYARYGELARGDAASSDAAVRDNEAAIDTAASGDAKASALGPVRAWTNRLYVIPCGEASQWPSQPLPEGKLGLFYEFSLTDLQELMPLLGEKLQTAVCIGIDPAEFLKQVRESGAPGIDRAVCAGEALEFDTIWDRKDLIAMLSAKN